MSQAAYPAAEDEDEAATAARLEAMAAAVEAAKAEVQQATWQLWVPWAHVLVRCIVGYTWVPMLMM